MGELAGLYWLCWGLKSWNGTFAFFFLSLSHNNTSNNFSRSAQAVGCSVMNIISLNLDTMDTGDNLRQLHLILCAFAFSIISQKHSVVLIFYRFQSPFP
jgi:threonine/homoserine efflux transporter RhtA